MAHKIRSSIKSSGGEQSVVSEYLSQEGLVRVEGLRVLVGGLVRAGRARRARPRAARRARAALPATRPHVTTCLIPRFTSIFLVDYSFFSYCTSLLRYSTVHIIKSNHNNFVLQQYLFISI